MTFSASGTEEFRPRRSVVAVWFMARSRVLCTSSVGKPSGTPPIAFSAAATTPESHVSDPNAPIPLAYGELVPGTGAVNLTAPASPRGYEASATLLVTLVPCSNNVLPCMGDESAFFSAPSALTSMFLSGRFFADPSELTIGMNPVTNVITVDIANGGTDFTFVVPEPASRLLFGIGLLGLGLLKFSPLRSTV